MCNGTIMDKLISFSIPLMLSGILQLMFNAVDIVVVGRFSGSQALAAVGSTTALINVFTNLFIGISLGANVLAARYYATGKALPEKQPDCRIFSLYPICLYILIKLHRDPPADQIMPDDLPCFQRLFHIDDPLVLRTAECQCHAVELLNKLAVHEDIDQA